MEIEIGSTFELEPLLFTCTPTTTPTPTTPTTTTTTSF